MRHPPLVILDIKRWPTIEDDAVECSFLKEYNRTLINASFNIIPKD